MNADTDRWLITMRISRYWLNLIMQQRCSPFPKTLVPSRFKTPLSGCTHRPISSVSSSPWSFAPREKQFLISCSRLQSLYSPIASVLAGQKHVRSLTIMTSDEDELDIRKGVQSKFVSEIVSILANNEKDLESRLTKLAPRLSLYTITEIFEVLNARRILGLRLFDWIQRNNPKLHKSARLCSFFIDNLGRLGQYDTMLLMLKEFSSQQICLTHEAFGFLASTESSLAESTNRVVDLLNQAGRSCRNSGLYALVDMFSRVDMFEMAKYVIKITEFRKEYYTLMIREMCKRDLVEDALGLIKEMEESSQVFPDTNLYNHILGSLCRKSKIDEASKILNRMRELGVKPDAITFEILINLFCTCGVGKLEDVQQILDEMGSVGIEPRIETHAFIIKAMFAIREYEAAHKYVIEYSGVYRSSSNMMHSLMARLYLKKGDVVRAGEVLFEMMNQNLKPDFNVYMDVVKQLKRSRRDCLAWDLKSMYKRFVTVR